MEPSYVDSFPAPIPGVVNTLAEQLAIPVNREVRYCRQRNILYDSMCNPDEEAKKKTKQKQEDKLKRMMLWKARITHTL